MVQHQLSIHYDLICEVFLNQNQSNHPHKKLHRFHSNPQGHHIVEHIWKNKKIFQSMESLDYFRLILQHLFYVKSFYNQFQFQRVEK